MSLPAEPTSAAVARRFVRDVLADWGAGEFETSAVLLTSELVTNALLHARSAPVLSVRLVSGRLRVSVSDTMPTSPVRKHYGKEAATGRGLLLIETISDSWGSELAGAGKVVWFELAPDEGAGTGVSTGADAASPADQPPRVTQDRGGKASRNRRPSPGGPRTSARQARSRFNVTTRA